MPSKKDLSPDVTLKAFLAQVVGRAESCQEAVNGVHLESKYASRDSCSLNTSSYSRARQRMNNDAVQSMTRQVDRKLSKSAEERWLWKNRRVKILDGSTIGMADTPENAAVHPKRSSLKEYKGYPIAPVMLASSLETGSVVDFNIAAWRGKGTG